MTKKARRVLRYPTQAKNGLEWGTQPSLPVEKGRPRTNVLGYSQPSLRDSIWRITRFPTEVAQDEGSLPWALVLVPASSGAVALFQAAPLELASSRVAASLAVVASSPEPAVALELALPPALGGLAVPAAPVGGRDEPAARGVPVGQALRAGPVAPGSLAASAEPALVAVLAVLAEPDQSGAGVAPLAPEPAHAVPREAAWRLRLSAVGRGLRQRTGRGLYSPQSCVVAERLTAADAAGAEQPIPHHWGEDSRRPGHRYSLRGCR
jgi:hypothetical protein